MLISSATATGQEAGEDEAVAGASLTAHRAEPRVEARRWRTYRSELPFNPCRVQHLDKPLPSLKLS